MNSASDLLEGASAVIDAWLLQSGATKSVRPLQGALEVGGRALLAVGSSDSDAADRYRESLRRLEAALPEIENRFRQERQRVLEQGESLSRAARWVQERREVM